MANVPKRVTDRLSKSVAKFQRVLAVAKDRDVNESDTASILKDILADVFGYDKYLEITSEYEVRGTFCDLAVKVDGNVQFLIEAKAVGIDLKSNHVRQAIDYGANHGIQWILLSNGIEWQLYRIRFEQPISYDLVCSFDFMAINPKDEKDRECLFLLTKEGLAKDVREVYFEKVQSVNRFVIGNLILSDPVLAVLRRELRKFADGLMVDVEEVEAIVRTEVLKRELLAGERAEEAQARLGKFYRKGAARRRRRKDETETAPVPGSPEEDVPSDAPPARSELETAPSPPIAAPEE